MPHRIACPRCAKVGLVRIEQLITGTSARQVYHCGYCEYQWDQLPPPTPAKAYLRPKPDRRKPQR